MVIISFLFNQITSVPLSLYTTFVLEEKYGFNKQTLKTWISDYIKSTVLSAVIGIPVLSGLIYLIKNYAGPNLHICKFLFSLQVNNCRYLGFFVCV
jgi:STE24 endopeptidase